MALKNTADGQLLQTNVSLWSLNTRGYTVACWARFDTTRDWAALWAFETSQTQYDILYMRTQASELPSNGCALHTQWTTGGGPASAIAALTVGQWYYLAVTRPAGSSQTANLYGWALGSGTLTSATGTTSAGTPTTPNFFTILDDNYWTGENSNSTIAHVKVWDAVLTQAELRKEMFSFRPQRTGDLKVWNPCEELQQGRRDYSGNGRIFTITGTPTKELGPPIRFVDIPYGYRHQGSSLILLPNMSGAELHIAPSAAAGPATITGTGALTSDSATIAGTATRAHTGIGALTSQAPSIAGTAERMVKGTGALTAAAPTIEGTAKRVVTGIGALASAVSTISGTGERAITGSGTIASVVATVAGTAVRTAKGTGALSAQAATVAGTAERTITGTGDLTSAAATIAGTGAVGNVTVGSGALTAQDATIVGTAERTLTGTGALTAQAAAIAGTAERTITGTGALASQVSTIAGTAERILTGIGTFASQAATIAGTGVVAGGFIGSGALVAQSASIVGTAERMVTGTGAIQCGVATINGVAIRTITGTGALTASDSTMAGTGGGATTITPADLAYILAAVKSDPEIMTVPRYIGLWRC